MRFRNGKVRSLYGRHEVAAIFPFEPLEELDVSFAGLVAREDIFAFVLRPCDIVAVDQAIEINEVFALLISRSLQLRRKMLIQRLCQPEDGIVRVLIVEREELRPEDFFFVRLGAPHIRGNDEVHLDAVIVLGIPFEEAPRVAPSGKDSKRLVA